MSLNVYVILRDVKDGVHSQKGWSNTGEKAEPCMLAYSWFIGKAHDQISLKKSRNEKIMLTSSFAFTCYLSRVSVSLDCL